MPARAVAAGDAADAGDSKAMGLVSTPGAVQWQSWPAPQDGPPPGAVRSWSQQSMTAPATCTACICRIVQGGAGTPTGPALPGAGSAAHSKSTSKQRNRRMVGLYATDTWICPARGGAGRRLS